MTRRFFSLMAAAGFAVLALHSHGQAQTLELKKGDSICLVGNALGERMQHHNWWETLLHQRFGGLELSVRNLCFPGDEPFERIRSKNFGDPDAHLTHSKASVVLYFFGFNESFHGESGVTAFAEQIKRLVAHTKQQNYSGKGVPRIVLVSPIAFENTGDANLPDGVDHNQRLELYTSALADAARQQNVGFVDLFHPTLTLFERHDERLTLNGAHLNDAGYRALAPVLMRGLFGDARTADAKSSDGRNEPDFNQLKAEIDDKNFHWWHRYRAVNGFSIYGDRGKAGSDGTYNNTDVMEREACDSGSDGGQPRSANLGRCAGKTRCQQGRRRQHAAVHHAAHERWRAERSESQTRETRFARLSHCGTPAKAVQDGARI